MSKAKKKKMQKYMAIFLAGLMLFSVFANVLIYIL